MKRLFTRFIAVVSAVVMSTSVSGQCAPDVTPPSVVCGVTGTQNVNAGSSCTYLKTGTDWDAVGSDNCSVASTLYALTGAGSSSPGTNTGTSLDGVQFVLGTTTVTWTVTDGAGLTSTCSYTVIVADVTPPTIVTCPTSTNFFVDATPPGNCVHKITGVDQVYLYPSVTDNCTAGGSLSYELTYFPPSGPSVGPLTNPNLIGTNLQKGGTLFVWRVRDAAGNYSSNCSYTITVVDNTPPVLTCGASGPQNVTANASCKYVVSGTAWNSTATDNCAVSSLTYSLSGVTTGSGTSLNGVQFNLGTTTVTWTATDNAATPNTSTCSYTVVVSDVTPPVLTCNNTINQNLNTDLGECTYTNIGDWEADAIDNCSVTSVLATLTGATTGTALTTLTNQAFNVGTTVVTWTATDGSGNTTTCSFNVTVTDVELPQAICQNITVQLDATGVATITPADIDNGSNDACGIQPLVLDITSFDCTNVGANTVELTVTDNNNNVSTCTATVTVEDNVDPIAICQNITVQLDASGAATITPAVIDNGSNDACGILNLALDITSFDCTNVGANTVELTVTDNNGNTSTCTSTVTVEDNVDPIAICQNITVQLDATGAATITPADVDNGSNDACGILNLALDITSFDCTNIGGNTVQLTVTDNNNNISTCTATITVEDNVAPQAICQNITVQLDATGVATIAPSDIDNGSNDACGIQPLVLDITSFDCTNVGANTVELTVTDNNNNVSTCTATVTVEDNVDPIAICQNITVQLDASGVASITPAEIDNGSNDACGILNLALDITSFDCTNVGTNTVELTVTDNNGNTTTCTSTVTVEDNVDPIAICQNITVQLDATGAATITPADVDNGSNDACGIQPLVLDITNFDCTNVGPNTVQLTVTDNNGNLSTCSATVTVVDNLAPVINCTQSDTLLISADAGVCTYLHSGFAWDVTSASDNCDPSPVITFELTDIIGNPIGSGITLDNVVFSGLTNVIWTATDIYGNAGTCSFVVVIQDSVAPIIDLCTTNQSVLSDPSYCTYTVPNDTWDINGTDNCGSVSYVYELSGATIDTVNNTLFNVAFNLGTTNVTAILLDGAGNSDTCSFNVIVEDTELPIITTCGAIIDTTVVADAGVCTYTNVGFGWDALATDNCSIDSISYTLTGATTANGLTTLDGLVFGLDTTLVTWMVTDGSGNTTTCSFNVIVEDTELPIITTCGAIIDTTVVADAGVCTYTNVGFGWDALATDNCSIDSISYTLTGATTANGLTTLDGLVFGLDTTLVTWMVTDGSGNTTTCSFNVIVEDTELPIITTCGAIIDTTVVADAGVCTYTNNGFGLDALATDNCSIDSISYTLTGATLLNGLTTLDGITFEADTTLVTWTATDGSGNTTTCSFNVIVEDTELPVITTCGAIIDTTVVADAGVCTYTNNGLGWDALATDNCSLDSISYTLTGATVASGLTTLDGFEFDLDTTLVTWTATDGSGNTTTCSFNVIVQDNELPLITCAADQTVIADAGVCTYANIGTGWDALVTDNCSIDSISYTLTGATVASGLTTLDGFVFELDTTLVTWTATDGAGNTTSCSFNVIVEDTELPIITCIADSTVSTDSDVCTFTNNGIGLDATGTDNCSVTFDYVLTGATTGAGASIDGVIFNQGVTNILWTATDGSGNTATCSFNLTVNDTQVPDVLVCGAVIDTTVIAEPTICAYTNIGTGWDATASDNCLVGSIVCDLTGSTVGTGLLTLDGVIFNLDSTHVLWTITDAAGNTTTCSFNVIVEDIELPIITTCGAIIDTTVIADAGVCTYTNNGFGWDALATDNCSIDSISYTLTGATIASGLTTLDGVEFELDTTLVTWTATDGSGNTATCSYNVIVTDTQAPVVAAVLPDTTVECSTVAPVAADNCGPVTGISDFTTYSGDTIVVVTWTFSDASGNTATSTQTITFDDVTAPEVPVIADAVAQCDTTVSAATTSDVCMGTITGTTLDPLTYSTQGTFVINWTFDDGNGNTATATQTVIIEDVTAPSITPPATVNVYPNNAGCTATGVDLGIPTTLDNCQVTAVVNDGPTVYPLGATTVTWIVTDVAGNTTSATQTVNVLPLTSTLDTIACDVYVSPDGIDLTSFGSGTYTAVIPGSFGCDSTITINLTLNQSTTSEITLSSCESYSAPDGQVYTNSGVFTAIIPNSQGCDSTITINLTIDSIETTGIQLNELVYSADQSNVLYQWVSCENNYAYVAGATQQTFEPQLSGDYAVILTNNTCVDTSECLTIDIDLLVPQVVTPNGDGKNDVFEIQGIYDHPNNVLEIYNRWGSLVYRQEGYQNTWGGECTEGLSFGGNILPTGTYFYILDLGDNDGAKPSKGYIFLTK